MYTGPAFHTRAMERCENHEREPTHVPEHVMNSFENIQQFDEYALAINHDLLRARQQLNSDLSRHSTPQRCPRHGGVQATNLGNQLNNLSEVPHGSFWENTTYVRNLHGDIDISLRNPLAPSNNAGTRIRDTNPLNYNVPECENNLSYASENWSRERMASSQSGYDGASDSSSAGRGGFSGRGYGHLQHNIGVRRGETGRHNPVDYLDNPNPVPNADNFSRDEGTASDVGRSRHTSSQGEQSNRSSRNSRRSVRYSGRSSVSRRYSHSNSDSEPHGLVSYASSEDNASTESRQHSAQSERDDNEQSSGNRRRSRQDASSASRRRQGAVPSSNRHAQQNATHSRSHRRQDVRRAESSSRSSRNHDRHPSRANSDHDHQNEAPRRQHNRTRRHDRRSERAEDDHNSRNSCRDESHRRHNSQAESSRHANCYASEQGRRSSRDADRRRTSSRRNIHDHNADNHRLSVNQQPHANQGANANATYTAGQSAHSNSAERREPQPVHPSLPVNNQSASSFPNAIADPETRMYDMLRTPAEFRRIPTRQPQYQTQQHGNLQNNYQYNGNQQYTQAQINQQIQHGQQTQPLANTNINWHLKGPEPKIPTYTGLRKDYPEWKSSITMFMDSYPENIRVATLKEHLDPSSLSLVSYISVTDPNAYEQIWQQLDRKYQQGLSESHYHTGQLLQLIRRKRCVTLSDLEEVHNTLKYHWSKLCKMGPQYAAYAESVLVGISDILYGQSQTEVDRLAYENHNFNVASVLNAIWNHIGQASSRLSNQRFTDNPVKHDRARTPPPYERLSSFNTKFDELKVSNKSPLNYLNKRRANSRSNSPSFRGETAPASPGRGRYSRSYKCAFCCVNDHTSLQCSKFTSEKCLLMSKQQGLCFKCLVPGHTAYICPYPTHCLSTDCSNLPVPVPHHAPILCKAIRAFGNGG